MREVPLPLEDDDPIERRRRQRQTRFLVKLGLAFVGVVGLTAFAAFAALVGRTKSESPDVAQATPQPKPALQSPPRPQPAPVHKPFPWQAETSHPVIEPVRNPSGVDPAIPKRPVSEFPPEVEDPKRGVPAKPLKKVEVEPNQPLALDPPPVPTPAAAQPVVERKPPLKAPQPSAKTPRGGAFDVVIAEGVGRDEKEAKKAAYRDAVSRVVGTLVDAETLVKNDEVISEKILEFSGGFVKTHEVLKVEKAAGGLVRVKIKATVEKLTIATRLADAKVATKEVRGEDLLAEKMTKEEAKKNATEILAKLYSDLPKLMKAEVKGRPTLTDTRDGVYIDVAVSVDMRGYEAFAKKAAMILDKIAIAKDSVLVPGELFQPVGGLKGVRYSQEVKFAGLPQLGQNTPKGYAVWLVTHLDKTGAQMRWNFYWVDADIAKSLATIAGEVRLHTQLLDGDGTLLTEEELPLFLTDVHEQYRPGGLQRESGFKSGYWMLCSYTRRKYEVDREKRETVSLFIAPLVTQLDAGLPGLGGNQGEYMLATGLRRKIKLTDDDLGRLKQVKASVELHVGQLGQKKP